MKYYPHPLEVLSSGYVYVIPHKY